MARSDLRYIHRRLRSGHIRCREQSRIIRVPGKRVKRKKEKRKRRRKERKEGKRIPETKRSTV